MSYIQQLIIEHHASSWRGAEGPRGRRSKREQDGTSAFKRLSWDAGGRERAAGADRQIHRGQENYRSKLLSRSMEAVFGDEERGGRGEWRF